MYLRIIWKMLVEYNKITTIGSDNKLPLYWYFSPFFLEFLNIGSNKLGLLMMSRS